MTPLLLASLLIPCQPAAAAPEETPVAEEAATEAPAARPEEPVETGNAADTDEVDAPSEQDAHIEQLQARVEQLQAHAERLQTHVGQLQADIQRVEAHARAASDEVAPWWDLHLQVRPRTEKAFAGHLGLPRAPGTLAGQTNYQTTSRMRVTVEGGAGVARGRASIQDVRTWASESSTRDFSAEGIDFHEGWLQIGDDEMFLRLGRQELVLDEQRLVGANNWSNHSRSFDALLIRHAAEHTEVTLFATRVADGFKHDVLAAHGMVEIGGVRLAVPMIFETNAAVAIRDRDSQPGQWHRFTGGFHASADGALSWRAEAYAQTGSNHFAYMFGGRAGYEINRMLEPTLWVDYLSGDDDPTNDETGAFDTLFATNHKHYGYMDRFLSLPADTRSGGLVDLSLKNRGELGSGTLEVAIHEFMLAAAEVSPATGTEHSRLIGFEADVIYTLPLSKWLALLAGGGVFIDQGDFRSERRALSEEAPVVHDWLFVMLDLSV